MRDNIHSADLIAAFAAFHAAPRAGRRLQHRRRPLQQLLDARGDRGLRAGRRPRAELGDGRGAADRRPPLVDLRPGAVRSRLPGLEAPLRRRGHPRGDVRAERRALDGGARHEALGRDPGPERGGLGRDDGRRASSRSWSARRSITRSWSSTTAARTAPPPSSRRSAPATRGSGSGPPTTKRASGWRSGPASTCSRATPS